MGDSIRVMKAAKASKEEVVVVFEKILISTTRFVVAHFPSSLGDTLDAGTFMFTIDACALF
jgi:hypothetical protein